VGEAAAEEEVVLAWEREEGVDSVVVVVPGRNKVVLWV